MKKAIVLLAALSFIALPVAPASADALTKAENTFVNGVFGWLECPKALRNEVAKAARRWYVGVVVTAPVMCGLNVGVRYFGVAADIATILWDGNAVNPAVFDSDEPPLTLK